jgi:hypothetical protein
MFPSPPLETGSIRRNNPVVPKKRRHQRIGRTLGLDAGDGEQKTAGK